MNADIPYGTGNLISSPINNYRGPGATGYLLSLASASLAGGQETRLIVNNKYTDIVRRWPKNFIFRELSAGKENLAFGRHGFAATVGLRLLNGAPGVADWLSPFLSTEGFLFTPAEYLDLRERVEQTARMADRLPRGGTDLEDLNTGFFRHYTLEAARSFLAEQLDYFVGRGEELFRRYTEVYNGYGRRAIFRRLRDLRVRGDELDRIVVAAAEPLRFWGRHQEANRRKEQWRAYRRKWLGEEEEVRQLPATEELAREQASLRATLDTLNREQAAAILSLSPVTADPVLGEAAGFQKLAEALSRLERDIDEAGLFQLPVSGGQAATTARQRQALGVLLERLRNVRAQLPQLDEFYRYRHFWYAQPGRLRRLLSPLLPLPRNHWAQAFSGWYFDRCLEQSLPAAGTAEPVGEEVDARPETPAPALPQEVLLQPGAPVPENTEVLIDLTGGEPPAGYSGEFYALRPLADTGATHLSLAGARDARLTFLQHFLPAAPPAWRAVPAATPPPGTGGRLAVQVATADSWQLLEERPPAEAGELRLYLPHPLPEADAALLIDRFDQLVLSAGKLTIHHGWTPGDITQALLSDGYNGRFLAATLLRAAEACGEEPFVGEDLVAIGREIRVRCGLPEPEPHPLMQYLAGRLRERLPAYFFTLHKPWRDTFLPLVALAPGGEKTVLLPDGRLPGDGDAATQRLRRAELETAGMRWLVVGGYACWEDVDGEMARVAEVLESRSARDVA